MKRYLINVLSMLIILLLISCDLFKSSREASSNNMPLKKEKLENKEKDLLSKKLLSLPLIGVQTKTNGSFKYEYSSYDFNSKDQWGAVLVKYKDSNNNELIKLTILDKSGRENEYPHKGVEILISQSEIERFKKAMANGESFKAKIINSKAKQENGEGRRDDSVEEIDIQVKKGEGDSEGFVFLDTKIYETEWNSEGPHKGPKEFKDQGELSFIFNTLKFEEKIKREEESFEKYLKEQEEKNKKQQEAREEEIEREDTEEDNKINKIDEEEEKEDSDKLNESVSIEDNEIR